VQAAAGHGVDSVFDGSQVVGGVGGEVGALADVVADEAVAVFVGRALPWRVRLGEVDIDAAPLGQRGVTGHLAASVPGQCPAQLRRDPFEDLDQRSQRRLGTVVFGEIGQLQVAAGTVEHRHDRAAVERADDEIAFEVADLGPLLNDLGAHTDQVERAQRANRDGSTPGA